MDASVEACDDFWTHACGGWLRESTRPPSRPRWSPADAQRMRYYEHLRTLVQTLPFPTDPKTITWKLQHMYESCMRLDNVESDGYRPLRKLITLMGGWHVLPEFNSFNWDYKNTLVKLFQAQGITPFFKVDVVPDPQDPTESIIKIYPSGLDLPDKSYYERTPGASVPSAYMQFLKSTVLNLGAKSSDADRFAQHTFFYQQRIAGIFPEEEIANNPFLSHERKTIGSLGTIAPSVPILDILQAMFPRVGIHQNTKILVPSAMYMSNLSTLLSTSDRGPLNDYMMWIFAASYIPYLNREFVDVSNIYKKILTGAEKPVDRWEMCISTLEKYMGFALAVKTEEALDDQEKEAVKRQVDDMFNRIRDAVRSSVARASWFDKELQEIALAKINTMTLQVGVSSPIVTDEYLMNYYDTLHVQRNDLLENIRNARDFELYRLVEKLMRPKEEYSWIDAASVGDTVTYIPTSNRVVVPQWLLLSPYYHSEYPLSVQYGGLGVQIAYAVVSSVLPWNALYDEQGVMHNETIADQSAASIRRAKAFLKHYLISSGLATEGVANNTVLSTVIHTAAVHQAHKAMLDALSILPHMHQPGMESYESDQLFFLSYAQSLCSKSTLRQIDIDITTSQHLNGSQLLPATLKQLKEFSHAFECPATSVYFASKPCPDIL